VEPTAPELQESKLSLVTEYLRSAPAPVTGKNLQKALKKQPQMAEEEVTAALTEAVQAGRVHAWPGRSPRYWHRAPKAFIQEQLQEVASEEALSGEELVARAARKCLGCAQPLVKKELDALKKAGNIIAPPIFAKKLYCTPGSHRALVRGSLKELRQKLLKAGASNDEIQSELAGPAVPAVPPDLAERIATALRGIEPVHGAPVPVQQLRAAVPDLTKQEFDRAALALADRQQVYLSRHDHGWALSKDEQEKLVHDGGDALYVAIAFRV
jgi:hypothetical protein